MSIKIRKKKKANGDYSLYLDVYTGGKRQYEFLNLYLTKNKDLNKQNLELAENIRAKRLLELANSEQGFIAGYKKKYNFVEYYVKLATAKPEAEKAWRNTAKHLRDFTGGKIPFKSISEDWLNEFRNYLTAKVANNTAHTYFSKIKAALRQAVKDKMIVNNPGDFVKNVKKKESDRAYLSIDEIERLAKIPCKDSELKRAFIFSCFTGLRLSDIKALTWKQVNGDVLEFRQKKTGSVEYLIMSESAKQILIDRTNNILNMPDNKIFNLPSTTYIGLLLKNWCKQAGIEKKVTFHVARHSFATLSLTQGVDLYTVSKLLGHKDIKATQIYAKVIDEKKRQAMQSLPLIIIQN